MKDRIDFVGKSVLQFLVVASALVRGALLEVFGQSVEDHCFSAGLFGREIFVVLLKELEIDPVLLEGPTSLYDPLSLRSQI